MAELVADYVLKRLREWSVHRIYGYPGDGINAFLGALDRADYVEGALSQGMLLTVVARHGFAVRFASDLPRSVSAIPSYRPR